MKIKLIIALLMVCSLIVGSHAISYGQSVGDYQSNPTGIAPYLWQDINNWQIYDGTSWITPSPAQGWPGQNAGTGDVSILNGHVITILSTGIVTQPFGTLTIKSGGRLVLSGGSSITTFDIKTMMIYIEPTPITGVLEFIPKAKLWLPANAVILVWNGGFVWNSQNVEIWIGGVFFGIGQGGGQYDNVYKFADFMGSGGTLDAQPASNSPICQGESITLTGNVGGATGTTEANGSVLGVNYSWSITGPNGFSATSDQKDYDITNPEAGSYSATLTVTTYIIATPYTNAETIEIIVYPLPEPTISPYDPLVPLVSVDETVVYSTEAGMSNYVWTVTGGTITDPTTPEDNEITVVWSPGFTTGPGEVTVTYTSAEGCNAASPTVIPVDIRFKKTVKDGLWESSDTWDPPGEPTLSNGFILVDWDATIDNSPSAAPAVCNDIDIVSPGRLTINPGNCLTVNGVLNNQMGPAGLIIESDATGTGSLLHNTDGEEATVKQHLTELEWHYVTSPITGALSGVFLGIYLKPFDESIDNWGPYIVPTTDPLNVMQGYAAWAVSPTTVSFAGTMNNGMLSIPVTRNATEVDQGWNLVGNPYPSPVDWNSATGWDKTDVDNAIYFWEGIGNTLLEPGDGTGNYHYYVGAGGVIPDVSLGYDDDATNIIPAMQGFFVHASGDGTLQVNNTARVHGVQDYWKSTSTVDIPLIKLQATAEETGYYDATVLRFWPEATNNHDGQYDAFKLDGYLVPQIYSITETQEKLAINTLPNYFKGTMIPLGFVAPTASGQYTISLKEFENMKPGFDLYLEDLLFDTMHKLSGEDSYTFGSSSQDDPNRFMLHFVLNKYVNDTDDLKPGTIYSYEKSVYVQMDEAARTNIAVFNLMGQKVAEYSTSDQGLVKIDLSCEPGYYVVRAQSGGIVMSEKVMIR